MKKMIYPFFALTLLLTFLPSAGQAQSEEEMKAWMEAMTPGENHKFIAQMEGEWVYTTKMWMDPTKDPEVSQGKATKKMIMGGRYMQENHSGTSFNMPFEGLTLLAYDNVKGKFMSTWIDNMGTGFLISEGDRKDNAIETFAKQTMPGGGPEIEYRTVITVVDKDHHTMVMYMKGEEGEMKNLEIEYKRK